MMAPRMMRGPDPMTADTAIRDVLRTPRQIGRLPGGIPRPAAHMRVADAALIVAREVPICPPPPR